MFAIQNNPDEHSPCPIIINCAPLIPQDENVMIPAIVIAICTTDDRAIKNLTSLWKRQTRAAITPPVKDHLSIIRLIE